MEKFCAGIDMGTVTTEAVMVKEGANILEYFITPTKAMAGSLPINFSIDDHPLA